MSRVLFDTSAMSELFRGHEGIAQTIAFADQIGVSPVALGKLKASFRGGTRYEKNQAGLQRFLCKPLVRALRTDAETADRYAQIHDSLRCAGAPIPTNDIWIAASVWEFKFKGKYADMSSIANDVATKVQIGDDIGEGPKKAKIHK